MDSQRFSNAAENSSIHFVDREKLNINSDILAVVVNLQANEVSEVDMSDQ